MKNIVTCFVLIGLCLGSVLGAFNDLPTLTPNSTTVSHSINGTDGSGTIIVQTGSEWESAEQLASVAFHTEKTGDYVVILDAQNVTTQDSMIRANALTPTGFVMYAQATPLAPSTTYEINYVVVER